MDWQHFIARLEHCDIGHSLGAAELKNLKAKCVLVALVFGAVSAPVSAQTSSNTVWRSDKWRVWKKDESCNLSQTNLRDGLAENRTNVTIELPGDLGQGTIEVHDMTGRLVHSQSVNAGPARAIHMPLTGKLTAGAYTVRLITAGVTLEQRLVVR